MGVGVESLTWDRLVLTFPLQPNLNHNSTAFGGSLSSALMLAGWSLTHARLRHLEYDTILVVSRSETRFLTPVEGDFRAICEQGDGKAWDFFRECLDRRGRGKLRLRTRVECNGTAATMSGSFVAMQREPGHAAIAASAAARS